LFTKKATAGGIGALSLLLTAGMTLAPAANATANYGGKDNSAFALSATGLLKIDPIPAVDDSDGFAQKSVAKFALPGNAVTAEALNAQAGAGQAEASILNVSVNLSILTGKLSKPLLKATAIEAKCEGDEVSSSLAKATIGDKTLDIPSPANTTVGVPGLASVTLNKQTKNKDGSVTVTAIEINVDGIQKVDLASVTCATGPQGGNPTTDPTTDPAPAPASPTTARTSSSTAESPAGDTTTPAGDRPDANGNAPIPTPVKAHLDVTG
jgi:hypothetical protein